MSYNLNLYRLRSWADNTVAVVCECGRRDTHQIANLRRAMPETTSLNDLHPILTSSCKRGDACVAELITPDYGVAEDG